MANPSVSLGEVFEVRSKTWPQEVRDRMATEIHGVKWTAGLPDVMEKVAGLFDIEIPSIMLRAWKKSDEIEKAIEESKEAPETTTYVELIEHTVKSEHHPSVEIDVNGLPVKKLEFTVALSLTLKGVILKIQHGEITQMQTGSCEVMGTISYGTLELAKKQLEPFKLPGSIDLGGGVAHAT
jgi:hypothetical protein